jgi:hypothetical protein
MENVCAFALLPPGLAFIFISDAAPGIHIFPEVNEGGGALE